MIARQAALVLNECAPAVSVRDDGGVFSFGAIGEGAERVFLRGLRCGFSPHNHVLGLTVAGEECFGYRGSQQRALPGAAFILHPGDTHDGRPGMAASYGYVALYVAPRLIAEAAGRRPTHRLAMPCWNGSAGGCTRSGAAASRSPYSRPSTE